MRIVVFTNDYKPVVGGVIVSIDLFRRGLTEAGHDVHIVAPKHGDFIDEEPYVYRVPAVDLPTDLNVSLAMPLRSPIAITMQGIQPALIHSQHPFWIGNLAADFARDLRVPLVFTFHTRYQEYAEEYVPGMPDLAARVMERVVRKYLERCAHIVAPTSSIQRFIVDQYDPAAPVTVVPTPLDLSSYDDLNPQRVRESLGLESAELLVYVGRLGSAKGLDFLLRAFASVAARHPRARLLLVGEGSEEETLRELAQELDCGDKVVFVGSVPHGEVPDYVAAGELFVFSSVTETQGLVLMEAMAAGTPVVAVKAPGPVDVLAQGGGMLVPPQEEAFAQAVMDLLSEEDRRQAMGRRAAQAVKRYSIPKVTECLLEVYEEAIAAGPVVEEEEN